jgi:hypothetical protein
MWNPSLGTLAIVGLLGVAILYPLHRLALVLEDRGHLYYLRKSPSGGASRMLFPLQEALDPATRHVVEIKDERRLVAREGVPGPDSPGDGVDRA